MKLNGTGLRRLDWVLLLEVYIERHRATPFAWGTHDCATFAVGWLDLVREDLGPQIEHLVMTLDYRTAHDAVRRIGSAGLHAAVEDWGQLTAVGVASAQRGDLVLVDSAGRQSIAVCVGDHAAGPGVHGLELVPMHLAVAAWRV
jgi:hypothetical protein